MNASIPALAIGDAEEWACDFESIFHAHFPRVVRSIAKLVRDSSVAEELAIEVFLKLWRHPEAHGQSVEGWLYKTAIRIALDELRRRSRNRRLTSCWMPHSTAISPERACLSNEESERVRGVLMALRRRDAELLLMRSEGLAYQQLATALGLNPTSVGTLLARAQQAFRKEYTSRYGTR